MSMKKFEKHVENVADRLTSPIVRMIWHCIEENLDRLADLLA